MELLDIGGCMGDNAALLRHWQAMWTVRLEKWVQRENNGGTDSQGLHTLVNEGGGNMSAGQRQLICFERTLLKRPAVLVLDEAIANLRLPASSCLRPAAMRFTAGLQDDRSDCTPCSNPEQHSRVPALHNRQSTNQEQKCVHDLCPRILAHAECTSQHYWMW